MSLSPTTTTDTAHAGGKWSLREGIPLLGILLVAAAFRSSRLGREALWYDELWSASFVQLSWFDIAMATLRFDIHPPAWNWQLQLWSKIGDSDAWLMLNSILWGVGGVLSVFLIAHRMYGRRVAWLAALFLAVMPVAVDMSRQVRPYAFLTVVVPWAWYLSDASLTREPRKWRLFLMGLLVLLAVYSHGSGILMAAYIGLAGLARITLDRPSSNQIRSWAIAQGLLVILCVPAVIQSAVRTNAAHLQAPTLTDIQEVLSYLWFGAVWESVPTAGALALGVTLLISVCGLVFRRGRLLILCFVVSPLLLSAGLSYFVKPMWFVRGFWFMAPFLCLAAALAVDNLSRAMSRSSRDTAALSWAAGCIVVVLGLIGCVQEVTAHPKPSTYALVLNAIDEELQSGDVIYVPQQFDLWGFARYVAGPQWGSALAIQDLNMELAAPHQWGDVLRWLGPTWRQRLHLEPVSCRVEADPANLFVGFGSANQVVAENPRRIFLVMRADNTRPVPELSGYHMNHDEPRHFVTSYCPGFLLRVYESDSNPASSHDIATETASAR